MRDICYIDIAHERTHTHTYSMNVAFSCIIFHILSLSLSPRSVLAVLLSHKYNLLVARFFHFHLNLSSSSSTTMTTTTTTLAYFLISFRNDTVCLIKARDRSHLDRYSQLSLYVRRIHCVYVFISITHLTQREKHTRTHRTKTKTKQKKKEKKETPSQNSQSVSRSSSICRKLSERKKMTKKK